MTANNSNLFPREQAGYYVSVKRGREYRLVLGPYPSHGEALANVTRGRNLACDRNARHWFDAFGTCKVTQSKPLPNGALGK